MDRMRDEAAFADMEQGQDTASASGGSTEQCRIPDNCQRAGKTWLSAFARAMSSKIKSLSKKVQVHC